MDGPINAFNEDSPIYTTYSPGLSDAELAVPAVTPMAITSVNIPSNENNNPRLRLKIINRRNKAKAVLCRYLTSIHTKYLIFLVMRTVIQDCH